MQGQRSAVGSLPEVIGFDHGSTSGDTGFDQQMYWTTVGNSAQSRLPDYLLSSSNTSMGHMTGSDPSRQDFRGWDFGESSSRAGQAALGENDLKSENEWTAPMNICTGNVLNPEQQHQSSTSDGMNQTLLINGSEFQLQPDLNMNTEIDDDDDDDDCQVLENPHVFSRSGGSRNEQTPFASTSSNPFGAPSGSGVYSVEETDGRPGCSLDGRRLSCKRKTLEANVGQPSEGGSTNYVQQAESRVWHTLPHRHNVSSGSSALAAPEENSFRFNMPEQVNSRPGLSFGQVAPDTSPLLDASSTTPSSRRNFRWRINSSQQGSAANSMSSPDTNTGSINNQPYNSLRLHPPTNFLDLRSASAAGNGNAEGQPAAVHVSSMRAGLQPRWNGSDSIRYGTPPSSIGSGVRGVAQHEASSSTSIPRSIADFPMFVPPYDPRSSSQSAPNWGLAGRNIDVSGNVASTSRISSGAGVSPAGPSWVPHRSPSQYPSRLAEYVRRSLTADTDSGGRNGIYLHPGPSSSQEVQPSSGSASQGRHSHSRSAMLLERRIDGALGLPYSLRTLAGAGEGRGRLVSEMRNVLDLVRRGEGLRIEDVMILDRSVFFGMADIHDRHRDMRLDVDNMSYEELLALGERIGSVSTGLSEEDISKQLKQQNYVSNDKTAEGEIEPCCICQEAYNEGEVLGSLECGHDFHADCIKQWLMQKNLCPICKTTGLTK